MNLGEGGGREGGMGDAWNIRVKKFEGKFEGQ